MVGLGGFDDETKSLLHAGMDLTIRLRNARFVIYNGVDKVLQCSSCGATGTQMRGPYPHEHTEECESGLFQLLEAQRIIKEVFDRDA